MEEFEKFKVDSEKLKANIEELKAAMERTIDEAGSYRESKDSLDAVNNKLNGLINGIDELVASSTKFMEEGKDLIYKIDGLEKAFRNERQVNLASKMDLLHEDMCSLKDDFREELNINTVPQIKETIKEVINSEESLKIGRAHV